MSDRGVFWLQKKPKSKLSLAFHIDEQKLQRVGMQQIPHTKEQLGAKHMWHSHKEGEKDTEQAAKNYASVLDFWGDKFCRRHMCFSLPLCYGRALKEGGRPRLVDFYGRAPLLRKRRLVCTVAPMHEIRKDKIQGLQNRDTFIAHFSTVVKSAQ